MPSNDQLLGACSDPPVNVANRISGRVLGVVNKLDVAAVMHAPVYAGLPAGDRAAGLKVDVRDAREERRIPRLRIHDGDTSAKIRSTTSDADTPAASAWKFNTTRWSSTKCATALTSSTLGTSCP